MLILHLFIILFNVLIINIFNIYNEIYKILLSYLFFNLDNYLT